LDKRRKNQADSIEIDPVESDRWRVRDEEGLGQRAFESALFSGESLWQDAPVRRGSKSSRRIIQPGRR
jgi:hypothetical protein